MDGIGQSFLRDFFSLKFKKKSDDKKPAKLSSMRRVKMLFNTWVKVFRIILEFRILRLTFHRKSASKS